jgi:DNA-binding Lrp family transcriptional regulator
LLQAAYQGGFPIAEQPFVDIAEALETDVETLIDSIRQLLEDGTLSRFGPLYDAASMGGSITLAAMSVPQERYDEVAEIVNAMPEVAHNYVIATESPELLQQAIGQIEQTANLPVYNFPKLQTFYLGLQISLDQAGNVGTQPIPGPLKQGGMIIDELDRSIVRATQEGLPVQKAPYTEIASICGCDTDTVLRRMRRMIDRGVIRRIGAIDSEPLSPGAARQRHVGVGRQ